MLSVSTLIWACSAPRSSAPASAASPAVESPEAQTQPVAPGQSWSHLSVVGEWPIAAEFESRGHLVAQPQTRVRVSPGSEDAYANWSRGRQLPVGTVLVAEFVNADGNVAERFAMEKHDGGWRYDVISERDQLQTAPAACSACHRQATSDEVFGPAR